MYNKDDKRRIYWLIDLYLSDKITASIFCDEFYYSYDLEISSNTLTDLEKKKFSELGEVAGRFSPFEEDLLKYPGVYYSEKELRQKVQEAKEILANKK